MVGALHETRVMHESDKLCLAGDRIAIRGLHGRDGPNDKEDGAESKPGNETERMQVGVDMHKQAGSTDNTSC